MKKITFETREKVLRHFLRSVFEELKLYGTQPVLLDIGSADMRGYSMECLDVSGHYVAMELDHIALKRGVDKVKKEKNAAFINANAEVLPFKENVFDIVVFCDMLAYCNKKKVLKEVERVLKNGGYALSMHNKSIGWSFYKMLYPEKPLMTEWCHSIVVMFNSLIYKVLGTRFFRTTFHTKADSIKIIQQTGLELIKAWTTKKSYTWHHFIAQKPDGKS